MTACSRSGLCVGVALIAIAAGQAHAESDIAARVSAVESRMAALAALKIGWSWSVRSTMMTAYQHTSYASYAPLTPNGTAWSAAGNLFWSPVKALDLGVEYRHGERKLLNGLAGQLDRLEFAEKYNV